MTSRTTQFAGQFTTVLLALATLVGAYVGALAIDRLLLFWVIVPVAAALVIAWRAWPRLKETIYRLSDYSRVSNALEKSTEQVAALQTEVARLERTVVTERLAGRRLGRQEGMGAVVATLAGATLEVIGVAIRQGQVVIGAALRGGSMPLIGSFYDISINLTGERQGVLRVVELTHDGGGVLMEPVEETNSDFWAALRQQAVLSNETPTGLLLKPANLTDLSEVTEGE